MRFCSKYISFNKICSTKEIRGFTPIPWRSENIVAEIKDNRNQTFIFSLDNKKVKKYIFFKKKFIKYSLSCFISWSKLWIFDIVIMGDPIREDKLRTNFGHKEDINALSGTNRIQGLFNMKYFKLNFIK